MKQLGWKSEKFLKKKVSQKFGKLKNSSYLCETIREEDGCKGSTNLSLPEGVLKLKQKQVFISGEVERS